MRDNNKLKQMEENVEEIFNLINDSYMVFNKNAEHGINHNTSLLAKQLISRAITRAFNDGKETIFNVIENIDPLLANCVWEDCEDIAYGVKKHISMACRKTTNEKD